MTRRSLYSLLLCVPLWPLCSYTSPAQAGQHGRVPSNRVPADRDPPARAAASPAPPERRPDAAAPAPVAILFCAAASDAAPSPAARTLRAYSFAGEALRAVDDETGEPFSVALESIDALVALRTTLPPPPPDAPPQSAPGAPPGVPLGPRGVLTLGAQRELGGLLPRIAIEAGDNEHRSGNDQGPGPGCRSVHHKLSPDDWIHALPITPSPVSTSWP